MARRSLATALFVDIVRSTEHLSSVGDTAWTGRLQKFHDKAAGPIRRYGGRIVQKTGDGFLASFPRPLRAIAAAITIRDEATEELGLEVRAGLHMGEMETSHGEVSGMAVHIAARVIGRAEAGEILVSRTVRDGVEGSGIRFEDRGEHELKGIAGDWRLFAVADAPGSVRAAAVPGRLERLTWSPAVAFAALAFLALIAVSAFFGVFTRRNTPGDQSDQGTSAPILSGHRQVTFTGDAHSPTLSPDGSMIAYARKIEETDWRIMVQDLAGEGSIEIGRADWVGDLRWSPKGDAVLMGGGIDDQGGVFLLSRLGGTPRKLKGAVANLTWSPEGDRFATAFQAARAERHGRIWITSLSSDDTTHTSIPDSFTFLNGLDWSPNGALFAYTSWTDPSTSTLGVVGFNGERGPIAVTDSVPLDNPRWLPTGDAIYYLRMSSYTLSGRFGQIMRVEVDSATGHRIGDPVTILSRPETDWFDILDNGTRLAYVSDVPDLNLRVMTPSPGRNPTVHQITTGTDPKGAFAISPDGRTIAIPMGSPPNLYLLPLEGGEPRRITFLESGAGSPAWSPEGQRIAFVTSSRIGTIRADGTDLRVFERSRVSMDPSITWAPGHEILYLSPGNRNLVRLDPSTGSERPLLSSGLARSGWILTARQSPGGGRVALWWNRTGGLGIWILGFDDLQARRVASGDFIPPIGWSSDGRWIYAWNGSQVLRFPSEGGAHEAVLTIDCGGQAVAVEMLLDGKGFVCLGGTSRSDIWVADLQPVPDRD